MPKVWGVRLTGDLPDWVSAKDVILEMLRRHGVEGAVGCVLEYHGPGLSGLSAMDRHVIANMGTELGATSSVFPSDERTREFLRRQDRDDDWLELTAGTGASYDLEETIDLSSLQPLIARPSSPGNVVPVAEVADAEIYQAYIGSSANPGYRDLAMAASIVKGRTVNDRVSFDVNPASRQILTNLTRDGHLGSLLQAGARVHQAGCNGCIGMGQAPATDKISLRTVPRNFPGRSGTKEDRVYLVSPETAAASALSGVITDPRTLEMNYPQVSEPEDPVVLHGVFAEPPPATEARSVELRKGPNIVSLPRFEGLPDALDIKIILKVGDDISTDEILPADAGILPLRSNIPAISDFCFEMVDESYHDRAVETREAGGHAIVGGRNYGQGSSREHAALAPRFLGLRAVIAESFARIHRRNLVNFGVLPLTPVEASDLEKLDRGVTIRLRDLRRTLRDGNRIAIECPERGVTFEVEHGLFPRQLEVMFAGGLVSLARKDRIE
jgi:aconitate hydratase